MNTPMSAPMDSPASIPGKSHESGSDAGDRLARVGAVVIGRNEGDRLVRALEATRVLRDRVVYADSGSSDGSPERARALGAHVLALRDKPFTAAKGRQAGLDELLRLHPSLEFVQFIDGDCVLRPEWLASATRYMNDLPRVGAISGRRREEFPEKSTFNAIIDLDWDLPAGRVDYPGGDSLCRVEAIRQIKGWATDLIAGEDPDLGFRLRDAGWEVHRLADEMTLHDVNMRSLGAYWKRAVRAGYCYLEVGWRHRHGTGRWWLARVRSSALYGLGLPGLILSGSILACLPLLGAGPFGAGANLSGRGSSAWVPVIVGVLALSLGVLGLARLWLVLRKSCRAKGAPENLARAYANLNVLCKWANLLGACKYVLASLRGRRATIIEYKGVPSGADPSGVHGADQAPLEGRAVGAKP